MPLARHHREHQVSGAPSCNRWCATTSVVLRRGNHLFAGRPIDVQRRELARRSRAGLARATSTSRG